MAATAMYREFIGHPEVGSHAAAADRRATRRGHRRRGRAGRGGPAGTRDLTLDLTGVTHLGSAGVAALHRLDAGHRASGTSLRLYAPIASPADMILPPARHQRS